MKTIALTIAVSLAVAGSAFAGTKPSADAHECMTLDKLKSVIKGAKITPLNIGLRIPMQSGQGFRFDVGHHSDLIPATIPK
jgi:hypothetical protein